jgi:hypothetical protein
VIDAQRIARLPEQARDGVGSAVAQTSVCALPNSRVSRNSKGRNVSRRCATNKLTTGGGRQERRLYPGGEARPRNTYGKGRPIPRCLREFLFSAT